jgi:hypothetical protein
MTWPHAPVGVPKEITTRARREMARANDAGPPEA